MDDEIEMKKEEKIIEETTVCFLLTKHWQLPDDYLIAQFFFALLSKTMGKYISLHFFPPFFWLEIEPS
jgi:hypothetical protein